MQLEMLKNRHIQKSNSAVFGGIVISAILFSNSVSSGFLGAVAAALMILLPLLPAVLFLHKVKGIDACFISVFFTGFVGSLLFMMMPEIYEGPAVFFLAVNSVFVHIEKTRFFRKRIDPLWTFDMALATLFIVSLTAVIRALFFAGDFGSFFACAFAVMLYKTVYRKEYD